MNNKKNTLSIIEKLLLAAYELEEKGRRPFSAEDLVVTAWQKFPNAFGLAGFIDKKGKLLYPDSNRIYVEIMGSKPIRKRGLLIKVGEKKYQLTNAGKEHAKSLSNHSGESDLKKIGLSREIKQEIKRLIISKAMEKYVKENNEEINFFDACAFWRITPRSSAIELYGRFSNLKTIIEITRSAMNKNDVLFEHGGQSFSKRDLDNLIELHNEMEKKFIKEIEIIKHRNDERTS